MHFCYLQPRGHTPDVVKGWRTDNYKQRFRTIGNLFRIFGAGWSAKSHYLCGRTRTVGAPSPLAMPAEWRAVTARGCVNRARAKGHGRRPTKTGVARKLEGGSDHLTCQEL